MSTIYGSRMMLKTQVLIIGGGATGTGLARDLSLRGLHCILVERKDINAGASGANHGLLHSGGRYVSTDHQAARECIQENKLLKKMAPHCIEETGGLFVALAGDDEAYIADFPAMCRRNGITARFIDPHEALEREPSLSKHVIAAYAVPDATIDPFKLSLNNIANARQLGARLLTFTRVTGFEIDGRKIRSIRIQDDQTGEVNCIEANIVINASGAWAGEVAALAHIPIPMVYSKGSLLVTQSRITSGVINRLRPPSDGDIIVPGGTITLLGTTSIRVASPDIRSPEIDEIDRIIEESAAMAPVLLHTRYIRAYCGVRPLFSQESADDDRQKSRGYAIIDHAENGIDNFITITGGKLTTSRLMAEKAADLACERLGIQAPCRTHLEPLPSTVDTTWTQPGIAPRLWIAQNKPEDLLMCECEMVPQTVIDHFAETLSPGERGRLLKQIGLRSRTGKGPCQGTFCSQRIAAYLYDQNILHDDQGLLNLRDFILDRWRGQHPILWDLQLVQSDFQEALHCGFLGLELIPKGDE